MICIKKLQISKLFSSARIIFHLCISRYEKVGKNLHYFDSLIIIIYDFNHINLMDKKEYLQKILTQLEPIRDLASGLKILVAEWNLWDEVLDVLISAVQWAVNTAKTDLAKQKLQKWLDVIEKMKKMEMESKSQDERDLAELDAMINDFSF